MRLETIAYFRPVEEKKIRKRHTEKIKARKRKHLFVLKRKKWKKNYLYI